MKAILFVIDTLRADHLRCYGYDKPTSPNIDNLAGKGVIFENAYPTDVPTQPSFTAMFTGQRGINTGVVTHSQMEQIPNSLPYLPQLLAQEGYATAAASTLFIFKKYFARGFNHYMNPVAGTPSRIQRVNADEINAMAIPWIKANKDKDFFIFIHYWDPHCIYFPPEKKCRQMFYEEDKNPCTPDNHSLDRARKLQSWPLYERHLNRIAKLNNLEGEITDKDFVISQYDGEIRYTDDKVGEVLDVLGEIDAIDETLIILTSDHGESMGSHDVYFDHCTVHEHTARVPLIIKHPKISGKRTANALVQLIDLAPTILDSFNILPPEEMVGHNLLPLISGEEKTGYMETYSNQGLWTAQRMIRNKRWKLIRTIDKTAWDFPERELYDLSKDPNETQNLIDEHKDIADKLDYKLQTWLNRELGTRPDPLRVVAGMGQLAGTFFARKTGKAPTAKNEIQPAKTYATWRMEVDRG